MMTNRIHGDAEHQMSTVTVPEHHDDRIRVRRTQINWIGFITRPGQRLIVILAPDRDGLIAKAQACVKERIRAQTMDQSGCWRS